MRPPKNRPFRSTTAAKCKETSDIIGKQYHNNNYYYYYYYYYDNCYYHLCVYNIHVLFDQPTFLRLEIVIIFQTRQVFCVAQPTASEKESVLFAVGSTRKGKQKQYEDRMKYYIRMDRLRSWHVPDFLAKNSDCKNPV